MPTSSDDYFSTAVFTAWLSLVGQFASLKSWAWRF